MSDMVKDWIADYVDSHRRRFNPHDWPEVGTEDESDLVRMWKVAFLDLKPRPTRPEADTASVRLGSKPPRFRNDHLPAILAEIAAIRANRPAADGPVPDSRKLAAQQSRDCPHCGGHGWATVYHPDFRGNPVIEIEVDLGRGEVERRSVAACVSAFCSCPHGRFIRSKTDRDLLGRIPDFPDVFSGRTRWLAERPMPEAAPRQSIDPREAARRLADRMRPPAAAPPAPEYRDQPEGVPF